MFKKILIAGAVALAAACSATTGAFAQSVDEIIKKGELVVGIDLTNAPWGFLDEKQEPAGFDPAFAKIVADKMGVKLKIERVTGPTRIPFLLSGRADVIISTLSITSERAKQVWYTTPYAPIPLIMIAAKDKPYKSWADLKGVRVAVVRGSPMDIAATKNSPDATMMRFDDDAGAQQAVLTGQADMLGGASLVPAMLNKIKPGSDFEQKILVQDLFLGMAVRKGSSDLLQYLNTIVFLVKGSGELDALFREKHGLPVGALPVL